MIISTDTEKVFERIQHPFIKTLTKASTEGTYINIIKAIYDKLMTNKILNGAQLKALPLKPAIRQGRPHLFYSTQYWKSFLATAIRQKKEIKSIQIGNKKVKLSLHADDMILYTENPKQATQKLVKLNN